MCLFFCSFLFAFFYFFIFPSFSTMSLFCSFFQFLYFFQCVFHMKKNARFCFMVKHNCAYASSTSVLHVWSIVVLPPKWSTCVLLCEIQLCFLIKVKHKCASHVKKAQTMLPREAHIVLLLSQKKWYVLSRLFRFSQLWFFRFPHEAQTVPLYLRTNSEA